MCQILLQYLILYNNVSKQYNILYTLDTSYSLSVSSKNGPTITITMAMERTERSFVSHQPSTPQRFTSNSGISFSTPIRGSVHCSFSKTFNRRIYEHNRDVLDELLNVCKGILERVSAIESRQWHLEELAANELRNHEQYTLFLQSRIAKPQMNFSVYLKKWLPSAKERPRSLSVGHFTTVLTKQHFSENEREGRNCLGRCSKCALDPVKLGVVKKLVFRYYSIKDENKDPYGRNAFLKLMRCFEERNSSQLHQTKQSFPSKHYNCDTHKLYLRY